MGRGTGKRRVEETRVEDRKGKSQKKKNTGTRNVRKVAQHGFGASKSRFDKAAGAELCGQMRHENCILFEDRTPKICTPLWPEAHI